MKTRLMLFLALSVVAVWVAGMWAMTATAPLLKCYTLQDTEGGLHKVCESR